jgi:hypothetical protein
LSAFYFFRADRLLLLFDARLRGTFAPFARASERPIAMACLRLFTVPPFPPGPLFSVPFFFRRIALSTRFDAAFPYLRPLDRFDVLLFFAAAIGSPGLRLVGLATIAGGKKWPL